MKELQGVVISPAEIFSKVYRRAMGSSGKLLLVERVIPPRNEPSEGKFGDIMMMVTIDGVDRTESEFRTLFDESGFDLTRIIPTKSPMSII